MNISVLEKQKVPAGVKRAARRAARRAAGLKKPRDSGLMEDTGLLILRVTTGGLVAGHGSQKLFGWFKGPGFKGFTGFIESMGLTPGTAWAAAASMSEFGGGVLTTLGLLHPLGPLGMIGAMVMATAKAHWGKPIWASSGGAELPVTNMASALAITLTGPGRFSLDSLFGIRLPRALVLAVAIVEAVMLGYGIMNRPAPPPASTSTGKDETVTTEATGRHTDTP